MDNVRYKFGCESESRLRFGAFKMPPVGKKKPSGPTTLHVLSDSTGNLPRHMLAAFLTQFPAQTFVTRTWNFVQSDQKLKQTLDAIKAEPGPVMHAFVSPTQKKAVERFCRKMELPVCDLTGGFVEFLAKAAGAKPARDVSALHAVSDAYQRRIEAVEFTIQHDDGLGLDTIADADIVLAGVSRTSKTPTCMYLAQLGFKAANVALAINATVPPQLLALTGRQVVGLLIDPLRLQSIRRTRADDWKLGTTSYDAFDHIDQEVRWSQKLFARQGWRTLDVTSTAVEETAVRLIELLKLPSPIG